MTKSEVIKTINNLPIKGKKALISHFRINSNPDPNFLDLAKALASKTGILEVMDIISSLEREINAKA